MAPRSIILAALASCAFAQAPQPQPQAQQVQFNQVLNINGDMNLVSYQFPDGSLIETYSQSQQQLFVNQNNNPVDANRVVGSTSGPFMALNQQSIVVQTNGATNLVGAQMEMTMNTQNLQAQNVQMGNVYVAKLTQDRQAWQIQESVRSVNGTDMTARMVKMNQLDGEYQMIARMTPEMNQALTPFGTTGNSNFNVTGGGISESEFTDGFRMSIRSSQPMVMNTIVRNGVSNDMTAALGNAQSLNNYRYLVQTNLGGVLTNLNQQVAVVQMPVNAVRLQNMAQSMGATEQSTMTISVAQRPILSNPGGATGQLQAPAGAGTGAARKRQTAGTPTSNNPAASSLLLSPTFTPVQQNAVFDQLNNRIAVPVNQIDGEYILTVSMGGAEGETAQQGQQEPAQAPQAGTAEAGTAPAPAAEASAAPAGVAEAGTAPAPAAEAGAAPAGVAEAGTAPAGVAEAGTAPAGVAEAGTAPAGVAEAGTAPAGVAETGTAPAGVAAPAPAKRQAATGIQMTMAQINSMAAIQSAGTAVDVTSLLGGAPDAAAAAAPASPFAGTAGTVGAAGAAPAGAAVPAGAIVPAAAAAPADAPPLILGLGAKRRSLHERRSA